MAKEEGNIGYLSCDKMPGKISLWVSPGLGFEGAVHLTRKAERQEHEAAGHTVHSREEGPFLNFIPQDCAADHHGGSPHLNKPNLDIFHRHARATPPC